MDKWWDRVYVGDCIELLQQWPDDRKVDLVFADPPYNIGYEYDLYDDRRPDEEYLDWLRQWIEACARVLASHGSIWIAIGDEYAGEVKWIAQREVGLHLRSWVVWYYTFGVHCTRKFARSHTHLLYFVRDPKNFVFNSDAIRVPSARRTVYRDRRADPRGRVPDNTWILRPQDVPWAFDPIEDTWYVSRVAGTFRERAGFHGCQLPERLVARALLACSNRGDIVLDPFLGSGTTAVVAKKLGRRWVGIELSEEYARLAEARIGKVRPGDPLDGPEEPLLPVRRRSGQLWQTHLEFDRNGAASVARDLVAENEAAELDEILVDPVRNLQFIDRCAVEGLPGRPVDWCRAVLEQVLDHAPEGDLRLWNLLPDHPMAHACDMAAAWILHQGYPDLATILCDPRLFLLFHQCARDLCPGRPLVEYRRQLFGLVRLAAFLHERLVPMDGKLRVPWSDGIGLEVGKAQDAPNSPGIFRLVLRSGRRRELVMYSGWVSDLRKSYAYWAERSSALVPFFPWPGSLEWEFHAGGNRSIEQRRCAAQVLVQERPFLSGLAQELFRLRQSSTAFPVEYGGGCRTRKRATPRR